MDSCLHHRPQGRNDTSSSWQNSRVNLLQHPQLGKVASSSLTGAEKASRVLCKTDVHPTVLKYVCSDPLDEWLEIFFSSLGTEASHWSLHKWKLPCHDSNHCYRTLGALKEEKNITHKENSFRESFSLLPSTPHSNFCHFPQHTYQQRTQAL